MRRQRRRYVNDTTARMWHRDTARDEMQAVLQSAWKFPVLLVEIFRVADDRVADVGHMGGTLMGAPGHRLERQPGELRARGFDHRIVGHRMACTFVAMRGDAHEALVLTLLLGEKGGDAALARPRHAGDERPIDLARGAAAKGARQRRSGKAGFCHQQTPGRVLVDTMHEARTLALAVA